MTRPLGSFMQLAYVVDDMARYLEFWTKAMGAGRADLGGTQRGVRLPVQTSAHPVFGRIAIIDASQHLGTYVEVVAADPAMHAFNAAMLRAHVGWDGWDGTRPVRPVTELQLPGVEET